MSDDRLVVLESFSGYRKGDMIDADHPLAPLMKTCTVEELNAAHREVSSLSYLSMTSEEINERKQRLQHKMTDRNVWQKLSEIDSANYPGVRVR